MIARTLSLALLAATVLAAELPPPWAAEAIRFGSTPGRLPPYTVGESIEYTTPFLRVARAANKSFREQKRVLVPSELDPRTWTPELRLVARVKPVAVAGRAAENGTPRSVRLLLGAGEVKPTRMEADGGIVRAVFEIKGTPPTGATLEIRYASGPATREQETVERVPLDFRKARW